MTFWRVRAAPSGYPTLSINDVFHFLAPFFLRFSRTASICKNMLPILQLIAMMTVVRPCGSFAGGFPLGLLGRWSHKAQTTYRLSGTEDSNLNTTRAEPLRVVFSLPWVFHSSTHREPKHIVKSITQKTAPDNAVNVAPEVSRPSRAAERAARAGHWVESLRNSDVNRLWAELHRIVSNHPLVRASRSAGLLIEEGATSAYTDLTQELFVQLLTKARFQHYLDTSMTNAEIECEIGQIELTNLLTAELRKRHPESYRLARRISTLIQSSSNFRRFDSIGQSEEQHRRLADRVYGLSEWTSN